MIIEDQNMPKVIKKTILRIFLSRFNNLLDKSNYCLGAHASLICENDMQTKMSEEIDS